jgi:diguanylate cyclase (GGDEF)-like protein
MSKKPTTELIQNFSSMTRFRDHALVDIALCQSLVSLFRRGRMRFAARLFRVAATSERNLYSLSAWTEDGQVLSDERDVPEKEIPPALADAARLQVMHFGQEAMGKRRIDYLAWLPVVHEGGILAILEMRRSRPLRQTELGLAGALLSLYGNYLSLLHYSQTDTLTRLLNRKTFEESLRKMLQSEDAADTDSVAVERRQEAADGGHWLAVMDIDHFKQVNDRFGHLFGDEVLILVADEMRRTFRRSDKLFRFGGEEFVVVLKHVSAENAARIFERFRGNIARKDFPQVGKVTISIGVTEILPFDNSTTVLGRADDALYYAKEHGRDQVRFYEALRNSGEIGTQTVEMTVDLF